MARANLAFLAFNRGLVSRLGLARADVKRLAMSAQQMVNWMPRVLGSMMLRPGWGYLGMTYQNLAAKFLDFVASTEETTGTALLELTDNNMRVWVNDAVITRPAVTTAVVNGTFTGSLAGWTDSDEVGGVSSWAAPNYMQLVGNGTARAIQDQQVTTVETGVVHALKITIARGPVIFRCGSTQGGDDYVSQSTLLTGSHSLAFTPTGNFWIRFESSLKRITWVSNCTIEAAGVMLIPTQWDASVLNYIRKDQSVDVVFLACKGQQQQRIERRDNDSWSVVDYVADDGPFLIENVGPITMAPGALSGNTTLTASQPYFKTTNVGSLFSVTSIGQTVTQSITAQNTFTNAVEVTGVGADRAMTVVISNTFVATVTLQRSLTSSTGPWTDTTSTWTAPTTGSFNDGLDNQIAWYRIGVKTGDFVSGQVDLQLIFNAGSIMGIGRVTAFTSSTLVSIEVLTEFGGTVASDTWAEGQWSPRRGYPSAVVFAEGRLTWHGKDQFIGSVSDAFSSFDPSVVGDSGAIQRSIGSGPVDTINWALALGRLVLGGQGAEFVAKTSSLDEPLTPTNFALRRASKQGSAPVAAVELDEGGIYVQRGGIRVFSIETNPNSIGSYQSVHLSAIVPEIGSPGIIRMAVQRQPDTRLHCIRSDGTVAILVFDRNENVNCWLEIETGQTVDGVTAFIEDAVVLPSQQGEKEDRVYYVVRRTINGSTVRYLERWATEADCVGGQSNLQGDSYVSLTSPGTTPPAAHLEGKSVVVWADGADVGTAVDADGVRTQTYSIVGGVLSPALATAPTTVMIGLPYSAPWQSGKLSEIPANMGTPLTQRKKIDHLGVILADTHTLGLQYGPDFDSLSDLPRMDEGIVYDPDQILDEFDGDAFPFEGEWNADSRLCMQAAAPRPCTILAAVTTVKATE